MKKTSSVPAFTLIEALLYFVITSIFLLAALLFMLQISNISTLSKHMQELSYSSTTLTEELEQAIHGAASIDTAQSVFDNDDGTLVLNMNDASLSPTRFYWDNGNIMMQQGSGTVFAVNTAFVYVESLRFHKISVYKSPDQIIMDAELRSFSNDFANQDHSISVHSTLSLRSL